MRATSRSARRSQEHPWRDIFNAEHEDFRRRSGTFFEQRGDPVPRPVGEGRHRAASCGSRPASPGCSASTSRRSTAAGGRRLPLQRDPLRGADPRRGERPGFSLHTDIIVPYLSAIANDEQKQRWLPRLPHGEIITAIAMTEPGAGQRPAGHPHHRRRQGRPLRPQRLQDLHLQRHPRRPGDRGRAHRPRGRPQGHQPARRRARHGGLRARPQPRQDRPARPGHRRAVVHRCRGTQGEPARRGGRRASST